MLKSFSLLLLVFSSSICLAQIKLSGTVINLTDKKPVVKASIFLSNTTIGTATGDDGSYNLNITRPGQYDLIVTALGFEAYRQTLKVENSLTLPVIELLPKAISLKEVVIKPDVHWEDNYRSFKNDFLGSSEFAEQCKIVNPNVLDISYDAVKRTLTASSYDYIEIENKALGYKLRYLLKEFTNDYQSGYLYFEGNVLFEEMKGSAAQIRRWKRNRLYAYQGSSMHFVRSLVANDTEQEGFESLRLIRKPNPERPADSLIQAKLKKFRSMADNRIQVQDSINYWAKKSRLPKAASYLVNKPLRMDSLIRKTDQKGIYSLAFNDYLYIMYTKKTEETSKVFRPLDIPNYATTILSIIDPYIFFDSNGIINNPTGVILEGTWGTERAATILPIDYDPYTK